MRREETENPAPPYKTAADSQGHLPEARIYPRPHHVENLRTKRAMNWNNSFGVVLSPKTCQGTSDACLIFGKVF